MGEVEDVTYRCAEAVREGVGDAEDVRDHPDRDLLRVLHHGVGVARVDEAVDEHPAQRPGGTFMFGDALRGEPWEKQPARAGVFGRVGLQGR